MAYETISYFWRVWFDRNGKIITYVLLNRLIDYMPDTKSLQNDSGISLPERLYPHPRYLPIRRREIPIWPLTLEGKQER